MYSRKSLPKDHPYYYQKQVKDRMDAQFLEEDRAEEKWLNTEAMRLKADERREREKEKIEAKISSIEDKKLSRRAIWIGTVIGLIGVIVTIASLYFQVTGR